MNNPIFVQFGLFAKELLRMIDEGQTVSITEVCDNIEQGTITEFINNRCGFKNINVTLESIADINKIMKDNYYVSEREASDRGINNNGLVFLVRLIVEDFSLLLCNMDNNNVKPESYRDY